MEIAVIDVEKTIVTCSDIELHRVFNYLNEQDIDVANIFVEKDKDGHVTGNLFIIAEKETHDNT